MNDRGSGQATVIAAVVGAVSALVVGTGLTDPVPPAAGPGPGGPLHPRLRGRADLPGARRLPRGPPPPAPDRLADDRRRDSRGGQRAQPGAHVEHGGQGRGGARRPSGGSCGSRAGRWARASWRSGCRCSSSAAAGRSPAGTPRGRERGALRRPGGGADRPAPAARRRGSSSPTRWPSCRRISTNRSCTGSSTPSRHAWRWRWSRW